ncbi:MAG: 4Fe-4S dicluster domain-containing protein [Oligoflexia bacterium]|nr:4Fe-4S dicluster domain-containing protein [Oligoflexia bacterium]MBF0366220.1 4Fe-4S dicluster domain-containing protein [Oligoflexia bacterium]
MNVYFLKEHDFNSFMSKMIESKKVIGPVAKKSKFVFDKLESPEQLRLDYDVTILPPKKEFFPTCQKLVCFDGNKFEGCINPQEKILFGVHFYDVKAIDMTDHLFSEKNQDWNYLANRKATTIVASNIQKVSGRAFFASVGKEVGPKGHDAFITKINGGYVFEAITDKGEAIVKFGKFEKASDSQKSEAQSANESMLGKCPEKLKYSSSEIADKVRKNFTNEKLWEEAAHDCFSCGSCNVVCPTCYCFDVQDDWNLDQKTGTRSRYWDACLTEDFSKVSLGGGHAENFRESRGDRFRHRIMRKATYLNEKLGGPACVGCGRCSSACTADIADPVNVINKIMEAK